MEEKKKSLYTTIPIKLETKIEFDKLWNKLRYEGKVKYIEDYLKLLIENFNKNN